MPRRASEKISYSPPTTYSSDDCGEMLGSTGSLLPPECVHSWLGLLVPFCGTVPALPDPQTDFCVGSSGLVHPESCWL